VMQAGRSPGIGPLLGFNDLRQSRRNLLLTATAGLKNN
jgi:hypothetical protein